MPHFEANRRRGEVADVLYFVFLVPLWLCVIYYPVCSVVKFQEECAFDLEMPIVPERMRARSRR